MTNRTIGIILIIVIAAVGYSVWNNNAMDVPSTGSTSDSDDGKAVSGDRTEGSIEGTKAVSTPPAQPVSKPTAGTGTKTEPVNTNPGNTIPELPRAQVSYWDTGFTSIAVKKGQTVRFMNQSSKGMQVVSDSSTLNFGQTVPLMRGEYFDFAYYYVGTWKFHDALDPSKTGVVRVE